MPEECFHLLQPASFDFRFKIQCGQGLPLKKAIDAKLAQAPPQVAVQTPVPVTPPVAVSGTPVIDGAMPAAPIVIPNPVCSLCKKSQVLHWSRSVIMILPYQGREWAGGLTRMNILSV